jgi:hypothetical protein
LYKTQATEAKINKWKYNKLKDKYTTQLMEENICKYTSGTGLISKVLRNSNTTTQYQENK